MSERGLLAGGLKREWGVGGGWREPDVHSFSEKLDFPTFFPARARGSILGGLQGGGLWVLQRDPYRPPDGAAVVPVEVGAEQLMTGDCRGV